MFTEPKRVTVEVKQSMKLEDIVRYMFEASLHNQITFDHLPKDDFEFVEFLQQIMNFAGHSYNEYNKYTVMGAMKQIDQIIPREKYGKDNPNNGNRSYEITVGRESSPVMYLEMKHIGWNGTDPKDEVLSEEDVKKIKDIMRTEGLCDEADYELEETQAFGNRWAIEKFRFWWD